MSELGVDICFRCTWCKQEFDSPREGAMHIVVHHPFPLPEDMKPGEVVHGAGIACVRRD